MKQSAYLTKSRTPLRRKLFLWLGLVIVLVELAVAYRLSDNPSIDTFGSVTPLKSATPTPAPPKAGDVIAQDAVEVFTAPQTTALIRRNYPAGVPGPGTGLTKISFHYQSKLPSGELITVYGRAYLPDNPRSDLPIFAFAPGTTGIGDQCAASVEKPSVANWGTYDSHMAAYASQGFAAVTTDYEGMRDPGRIHHYMIGELEGRAVLDAVRALRLLPQSKDRLSPSQVFLSGYSQGGHAAFWADKIAASYAPDVKPLGVVGFGPVMSVKRTLTDVTQHANINWFGPNVVYSYENYYGKKYPGIILPAREQALSIDVPAHCIDTNLPFWGYTPTGVYTPEFIAAAAAGQLNERYPEFARDLDANTVGSVATPSAKRINQGQLDNVVLPAQQVDALPELCKSSLGPVQHVVYPTATHYNTMLQSFSDTLVWMRALLGGQSIGSGCQ